MPSRQIDIVVFVDYRATIDAIANVKRSAHVDAITMRYALVGLSVITLDESPVIVRTQSLPMNIPLPPIAVLFDTSPPVMDILAFVFE